MPSIDELVQTVLRFADGDEIEGILGVYAQIRAQASLEDLPILLNALQSDRGDFWVREMLAEPIAYLGGPGVLPELLRAYERNREGGHDNDSFTINLIDLVELNPEESGDVLRRIMDSESADLRPAAEWLLQYSASGTSP
jgi:hypothetical protein